ncbi:MAG: radical SAM protein [Promethearchaeota archaeon]
MTKTKIIESEGKTYFIKNRGIPEGCKFCLKGQKVVLFLNGICQKPVHCAYYCPISEERRDKNITFADEIEISSKEGLLDEIKKIDAKGMSITGGEPLFGKNLQKTLEYIKFVRNELDKNFHIHLYTNGLGFSEKIANQLVSAGLNEIRFHPSIENWVNIKFALNKGLSVGAEVPVIPDNENIEILERFILFLDKIGAEFINLNEFEYCFPNSQNLKERGYFLKKDSIASVEGSRDAALKLIERLKDKVSIKIHFCPIIAKDYYQLKNRYLRRAKSIKKPYEIISDEGLLLYGQIEGESENISKIIEVIRENSMIKEKYLNIKKNHIKLPIKTILKPKIRKLLSDFYLEGYIVEMIPFRGKYKQITEKTPIEVFIEENYGS